MNNGIHCCQPREREIRYACVLVEINDDHFRFNGIPAALLECHRKQYFVIENQLETIPINN